MPRFVTDSRPISAQHPLTEFYRRRIPQTSSLSTATAALLFRERDHRRRSGAHPDHGRARTTLLARQRRRSSSAPSSRNSTSSPAFRPGPIPSTHTDAFTRRIFDTISWRLSGPASLRSTPARWSTRADSTRAPSAAGDGPLSRVIAAGKAAPAMAAAAARRLRRARCAPAWSSRPTRGAGAATAFEIDRRRPSDPDRRQRARRDAGRSSSPASLAAGERCSCCCRAARRR